jgi:serine phosphatase RsbU (regulator of sigma subunit)/integral membrane sensor domain MASE1
MKTEGAVEGPAFAVNRSLRAALVAITVGAAYAVALLPAFLLFGDGSAPVFFPAAGVSLSALLLLPRRDWPWALLGIVVAEVTVDSWQGLSVMASLGFAAANAVEPLVGASLLRLSFERVDLSRRRSLVAFLTRAVVVAPFVGGLIGGSVASGLLAPGDPEWRRFVVGWWIGDGLGVLVVGGAILSVVMSGRDTRRVALRADSATLVVATVVAVTLVFWAYPMPYAYLVPVLLVATALRGGTPAVAVAGAAVSFVTAYAFGVADNAWDQLGVIGFPTDMQVKASLAIMVATALVLAAEIAEREAASRRWALAEHRREEADREVARASVLAAVSREAEHALGVTGRMHAILSRLVPDVADVAVVQLASSKAYAPPAQERTWQRLMGERSFADAVADAAQVATTSGATTIRILPPASGEGSLAVVPLAFGGRSLGQLILVRSGERAVFSRDEASFLESIADRAAISLKNAYLMEQQHRMALELQEALLGDPPGDVPGYAIASYYAPGKDGTRAGGDWRDVVPLEDGRTVFVVGDVVGRGLDAAAAMGQLRASVAALATVCTGPADLLTRLDEAALRIRGAELATVACVVIDPTRGQATYACAGHPPPLLIEPPDDPRFLWGGRSTPLGLADGARSEACIDVRPGTTLFLYTDGLIERRGETLESGLIRLVDIARRYGDQAVEDLVRMVVAGALDDGSPDDVALLVARSNGSDVVEVPRVEEGRPARR